MNSLRTLVPRLILFGLFGALMLLAANPLLKLAVVRSVESITGTRFTIDHVRSSYSDGYLSLHGCAAGHPLRPLHNLFEAETMVFDFDRDALSDRRMLVNRATIDGLRLGTRRSTSGFLDESQPARYLTQLSDDFAQSGQEWLNRANRQIEQDHQPDFASARRAREIADHWPHEMSQLQRRAADVAVRVSTLKGQLDGAGENPLRNIESYLVAIAEAEQLAREMDDIRGQIGRLEQQLLMDQETLASLQGTDEKQLTNNLDVLGLNADELTEYLLGPEVGGWVGEAISWVRWGRHFLPSLGERSQALSGRGETIWFAGTKPLATVEIENLVLRGSIPYGSDGVSFEGRIVGLTSHPELNSDMTELIIQTTTETPLLVQARLSHVGGEDEVLVNLPSYPRPERVIGNEEQFAISIQPSAAHIWMQIKIDGDALSGQLIMKEMPNGMSVATRNRSHGDKLTRLIESALEDINRIDLEVTLGGTLDHPMWDINSNLGPHLAISMRAAVEHELLRRRRSLLAAAIAASDLRIAALGNDLSRLKADVLGQLETDSHSIAEVKHTIAQRVEDTDGILDPDSPLREVFRR